MKLQTEEQIVHQMKPAPELLTLWFFTRCLVISLAGGGLAFYLTSMATEAAGPGVLAGCATWLFVLAALLIYYACLRRTYAYYVTNQRCVFRGGILLRIEHSVPYHKITDVEISQNIIERVLGISTLNLFTPGTASTGSGGRRAEVSFPGLRDSETPAASVNEILTSFRATGE